MTMYVILWIFFCMGLVGFAVWHMFKNKITREDQVKRFNVEHLVPEVVKRNSLKNYTKTFTTELDGVQLTDDEVAAKQKENFAVLDHLNNMAAKNELRALVITGPAGLGKSYGLEKTLNELDPEGDRTEIIKGYVRPTGLYKKLYDNRHKDNVVVFDDADSVFNDETSLNLLKAVLDTTDERQVSYLTERTMKDDNGDPIPKTFIFEATCVFISNLDFDKLVEKEHKLAPHFEALLSRAHFIDLDMKTKQDYLVRIRQVLKFGLLSNKGHSKEVENDVMDFIEAYAERMRELSLRAVIKLAELRESQPDVWKRIALKTMCKKR